MGSTWRPLRARRSELRYERIDVEEVDGAVLIDVGILPEASIITTCASARAAELYDEGVDVEDEGASG